jgi:hypothetical protein
MEFITVILNLFLTFLSKIKLSSPLHIASKASFGIRSFLKQRDIDPCHQKQEYKKILDCQKHGEGDPKLGIGIVSSSKSQGLLKISL